MSSQKAEPSRAPSEDLPKRVSSSAQADDDTQYDSAFKPLMWLLIPLIAVLIYGALT